MTPQKQKAELQDIRKEVIALTERTKKVCDSLDGMAKTCSLNLIDGFKAVKEKLYTLELFLQFQNSSYNSTSPTRYDTL